MKELLKHGADLCASETGETPLKIASFKGNAEIVKMLLERLKTVDRKLGIDYHESERWNKLKNGINSKSLNKSSFLLFFCRNSG